MQSEQQCAGKLNLSNGNKRESGVGEFSNRLGISEISNGSLHAFLYFELDEPSWRANAAVVRVGGMLVTPVIEYSCI